MRFTIRTVVSLVLLSTALVVSATEPVHGDFFPLANTRYGLFSPEKAVLSTDGVDAFVFFGSRGSISMARVEGGQTKGTARIVLENTYSDPAVIWNGTHFLVVASARNGITGTIVERDGTPLRTQFTVALDCQQPKLAFNGKISLLLVSGRTLEAIVLDGAGEPTSRKNLDTGAIAFDITSNGDGFAAVATSYGRTFVHTFDRLGALRSTGQIPLYAGRTAIASDGHEYLAVAEEGVGRVVAFPISPAGSIGKVVTTDRVRKTWLGGLAWSGDGYALVYRAEGAGTLLVGHLTNEGLMVSAPQNVPGSPAPSVGLVSFAGRLYLLRWSAESPATVQELRTGATEIRTGYRAQDQVLHAVAASSHGTLFIWSEGAVVYSGVRTAGGGWTEHVIGHGATSAVAASDGDEFLVIARSWSWTGRRLRANGAPRGYAFSFADSSYAITDLTWNGRRYVAVGSRFGEITAFGIERELGTSNPVHVGRYSSYSGESRVATDGRNTLVAWHDNGSIYVSRLGPGLEPLDDGRRRVGENNASRLDRVLWTGDDYLVVWHREWGPGLFSARVDRDGRRAGGLMEIVPASSHAGPPTDVQAMNVGRRVTVTWTEPQWTPAVRRFVTIDGDVIVEQPREEYPAVRGGLLAPLGDRLGFAGVRIENREPYYGGSRLVLAVGDILRSPEPPQRPQLIARAVEPDEVDLTWDAPPGVVNGYRLEARIGDGAWNEIDRWFDPEQRSLRVYLSQPGARASFRVRAINDGGAGAYAYEAVVHAPRRRAVR